ncbi:MAG: tRNA 2-selenouridine(34) synthase MnmH [Prolixibacteraceae bacterium]
MVSTITIEEAFQLAWPIIDVRSPGEFDKGHVPKAINIPLFNNDERAHVGTVYKQQSREAAIKVGYVYVNPKLDNFIQNAQKVAPDGKVIVHCWRGGMRSQSFAQHLSDNGFADVKVVSGGYKAYRNHLLDSFAQAFKLRILGGFTGSGKTILLKHLKERGHQVIDLEGIAHHKGSSFGAIGQEPQPTVEQFENNLFDEWMKLDLQQVIWLEDESHNIGGVKIPMPLYLQMREALLYFIDIPREERATFLVEDYTNCDNQLLIDSILRITKRLGGLNVTRSIEQVKLKNYYEAALITLSYYDKSYLKGLRTRNPEKVVTVALPNTNAYLNALEIEKINKIYA